MITLEPSKILIPVNFSLTSQKAIKHGAFLVQRSKGELLLLHVKKKKEIENLVFPGSELRGMVAETHSILERLEELAQEIRKDFQISVHPIIAVGSRPVEIVNCAKQNKVDLIVMGTEGDESTSTLFSGSNSYRVIKRSPIPVMTFRSEAPHLGFSHILLPIDTSAHSRQKVLSALQLAKLFASTLHVLGLIGKHDNKSEEKLKDLLEKIKTMAEEAHLVCTTEIVRTENPVGKTISQAKRLKADIIITMTDEKAGTLGILMRNYDHQLVDESEIPVLSIPPELHDKNIEFTK